MTKQHVGFTKDGCRTIWRISFIERFSAILSSAMLYHSVIVGLDCYKLLNCAIHTCT